MGASARNAAEHAFCMACTRQGFHVYRQQLISEFEEADRKATSQLHCHCKWVQHSSGGQCCVHLVTCPPTSPVSCSQQPTAVAVQLLWTAQCKPHSIAAMSVLPEGYTQLESEVPV